MYKSLDRKEITDILNRTISKRLLGTLNHDGKRIVDVKVELKEQISETNYGGCSYNELNIYVKTGPKTRWKEYFIL